MFIRRASFEEHMRNDAEQFATIVTSMDKKHEENKETMRHIVQTQTDMATSLNDIVKLRPAIEAGIASDAQVEYKKMLFKRVTVAVLTTAATIGGCIPLFQWLADHIKFL